MLASGVTLGSRGREELFEYAALAEEQGLESIWVGESWGTAAVPLLTQLLERTESIDVCSGIFNIYARTPGLVAMTANTLAEIGGGRFRVGLGASGPAVIENFHGVEFERPLRRTREYIEIIRALLAGERVDYDGELFSLSGFSLDADTHHECPIYVAAMGDFYREALADQGYPEVAREITEAWHDGDREAAKAAIDDDLLDETAPAGTPEHAREVLEDWAAVDGVDAISVSFPRATDADQIERTMEALAPGAE